VMTVLAERSVLERVVRGLFEWRLRVDARLSGDRWPIPDARAPTGTFNDCIGAGRSRSWMVGFQSMAA
jgi:hypothetical protein